jgi:transposase
MRGKKYRIRLQEEERERLREVIRGSDEPAYRIVRANILLELDEGVRENAVPDRAEIARRCHCNLSSVYRVSRQYIRDGIEDALYRKQPVRPAGKAVITGEAMEEIRALYRKGAPPGFKRWSLRLLATKAVEAGIVGHISPTSVQKILRDYGQ